MVNFLVLIYQRHFTPKTDVENTYYLFIYLFICLIIYVFIVVFDGFIYLFIYLIMYSFIKFLTLGGSYMSK